MPAVVITGSAGLIGSEAVQFYCERGHLVIGIDNDMRSRFFGAEASTVWKRDQLVCNRAFHWLVRLTVLAHVRDASNNLKLYRAEILRTLDIEEPHFAANMETGLKPLLTGYDVKEVPISWINRTVGMVASSFRIAKVAPGYFRTLMRAIVRVWRGERHATRTVPKLDSRPKSVDVHADPAMGDRHRHRSSVARLHRWADAAASRVERTGVLLFVALSVLYWGVTAILARRKLMWNDELYTFYIARLPSMSDIWGALMTGGEQLPPFFYVPTRAAFSLFGVGHLSLRLPEMLGFWVMSVALFLFVARRTSWLPALCAATFPLVTMAYYYAFEARPYGLVLGFSALALFCWQNAAMDRYRSASLACLAVSLCAAVSTHYYGVFVILPLALGEAVRAVERRQVDVPVWVAFALPAIPLVAHLPLIRAASAYSGAFWATPHWVNIPDFYSHLLTPALVPLALLLVLSIVHASLVLRHNDGSNAGTTASPPPSYEVAAAAGFIVIPAVCVLVAKVATGAFTPRYAMPAVIGFAVLTGFGTASAFRASPVMRLIAAACLGGWFVLSQGRELITATDFPPRVPPSLIAQPAEWLKTVGERDLRLVIADTHTFTTLSHYGTPEIKSRLVYLADPDLALKHLGHNSVERGMLDLVKPWFRMNVVEFRPFVAEHSRFLVYGDLSFLDWLLPQLQAESMRFELLNRRGNHMLVLATRDIALTPKTSGAAHLPASR